MGQVRVVRRGKIFHARAWINGSEHWSSLKTNDRDVANARAAKWYVSLLEDSPAALDSKITLARFLDRYLKHAERTNQKAPGTLSRERELFSYPSSHAVGKKPLLGLGRREIEAMLSDYESAGHSPTTVNMLFRHFRGALSVAVEWGLIRENPCKGIRERRVQKRLPRAMTDDQTATLLSAAAAKGARMHRFVLLGVYAGLRLREMSFARWEWFDFEAKVIKVEPGSGDGFQTKDRQSRTIPMHSKIIDALRPRRKSGYLFASTADTGEGKKYRFNPKKGFAALCRKAGLPWVTPHVLRHTFATRLIRSGVSIYKVKEWMGHSSISTTEIYAVLVGHDDDINRVE